jgi:hypothetical protein
MEGSYVYPYSHGTAKDAGDLKRWRESHQQNVACRNAIQNTINENFNGYHLNADAAKKVIDQFGYDRVNWVLAATIQQKSSDGRFSEDNVKWAKGFYISDIQKPGHNHADDYTVDTHPAVLDGFVKQARKEYQTLGLYDGSHCKGDNEHTDYTDKVLVLNPKLLDDKYKTRQDQLVLASGGFGCSPTAGGRKVYGTFLSDGEECQFYRNDFVGVLKNELLIGLVRQKMDSLNPKTEASNPSQGENNGGGMTPSL